MSSGLGIPLPTSLGQVLGPHTSGSVPERSPAPDSRGWGVCQVVAHKGNKRNGLLCLPLTDTLSHKVADDVEEWPLQGGSHVQEDFLTSVGCAVI